jgi:PKD repeat protein
MRSHPGAPVLILACLLWSAAPAAWADDPPTANFYVNCSNRVCAADSEASGDDFGIVNYTWTWGDGATTSGGSSASAPSHTYAADGTYTITLVVKDGANQTASDSHPVTVSAGPTASFTITCSSRSCDVDASASTGSIATYYWDWDDESSTSSSGATAHHNYSYGGTFTVHLTVYDANNNTAGASHTVTP